MSDPLLRIESLSVSYAGARVIADLSLVQGPAESIAIIGSSGAGKTTVSLAAIGLLPSTAAVSGRVLVDGVDMLRAPEGARSRVRGWRVGYVAQRASAALNPARRVGAQIVEAVAVRRRLTAAAARALAAERIAEVDLPVRAADAWPHELSGGEQRRVALAMALATDPPLLVADEPTASLDPLRWAEVVSLLARLRAARGLALLLITHDLRLARDLCDEAVVLRAGRLVERCGLHPLRPKDAYTARLIEASTDF